MTNRSPLSRVRSVERDTTFCFEARLGRLERSFEGFGVYGRFLAGNTVYIRISEWFASHLGQTLKLSGIIT